MKPTMNSDEKIYPIIVPTRSSLKSFNFYLWRINDHLTLIDAGVNSPKCWSALKETLYENGFDLNDLDQILITHNHEDHVGLIDHIVSKYDIPVYVPKQSIHRLKRDKQFFQKRIEFFEKLYREMGCGEEAQLQIMKLKDTFQKHDNRKIQADLIPIEDNTFSNLDSIQTPGHSPDHIVFYNNERKCLFGGDLLINHISSNALVEPNCKGERLFTVIQYERSLQKCLEIDVDVIYPGHGKSIHNPKELIKSRVEGIKWKADRILMNIANGNRTASQLGLTMYKSKYTTQFSLVMSEIIGHLDYLEACDQVKKELHNGVWHYFVNKS